MVHRSTTAAAGLCAAALILLCGCINERESVMNTKPPCGITRVAHRGGAGLAPENTMAAFRTGLEYRPNAVELDVHLSGDGRLVVIHDPGLARTTNTGGEVAELTLEELKELDAAARYFGSPLVGRQEIPTLEEVLDLIGGKAGVQVEIKLRADGTRYSGIEQAVIDVLDSYGMTDEAVILSFDFPTLETIRALEPELRTCALISTKYLESVGRKGPEAVADALKKLGATYAGVNARWLTAALYGALRAQGLGVGAWTVNDPKRMRELAEMGVDFITSDRPDILLEVLCP